MPGEDGSGGVEPTMTGYSSKALTLADANWKDPTTAVQGTTKNLDEFDFGTWSAGGPERILGWGMKDQSSNLLHFGVFKETGASWKAFVAKASDDTFTCIAHGMSDTQKVFVRGPNIPSPLAESVEYYVRDSATDTFKLSLTSGGAAIDLTATGDGQIVETGAQDVANGNQVKVPANAITLFEG